MFTVVCIIMHVNKYWNPDEENRHCLNVCGFHDSFLTITRQLKSGEKFLVMFHCSLQNVQEVTNKKIWPLS